MATLHLMMTATMRSTRAAQRMRAAALAVLSVAIGCIAGALLGVLAWGEGRAPVLALVLPFAIVFSRSRLQAFAIGFGYAAGVLRHAASFIANWFGGDLLIGMAAVAAYALVTGGVWCLGWSGSRRPTQRAWGICAAWLLALLAGIGVPGHPLIAAGYLLPGSGWAGCLLAWLLPALAPWVVQLPVFSLPRAGRAWAATTVGALILAGILLDRAPAGETMAGVQAQQTQWGSLHGLAQALQRLQWMAAMPASPGARVIVWPESIVGRFEPAMRPVLDVELLRPARIAGRTHVVGMDLPLQRNRLLNAAVAFHPDGSTAWAVARQPAPVSLWKPWRDHDTFVADWSADNILDLGPGNRAAVIFCVEEYLPILFLLNEARDAPTAYLVLANTWAAQAPEASAIQTRHSLGMARLFGRAYLKAENRPAR